MNGFRAYLPALVTTIVLVASAAPAAAADEGLPIPADPSAADGLRDLLAATGPAGTRKGLGIPSFADLLGKGWKAKAAQADAKLVAQLDTAAGAAPRAARAATAPDSNGADPLGAADSVKGKGGKQTRRFRMQAAVDPCPVIGTSYVEDGNFEVRGDFRAEYEVTTVERVGKYDITTNVVFDMRGATSSGTDLDATLTGIGARDVTVSVTRSQNATNRKTGKTKSTGPAQTYSQALSTIWVREGNFEEFIAQQDGDESPAPKRVLRSAAWDAAVDKFVELGFVQLAGAYLTTEKRATTPGGCLELTLEAPQTLTPGQTTPITGHPLTTQATATTKQILMQGFGAKAEYANPQGQTAELRSDYNPGWSEGRPWYDFTAPAKAWPLSSQVGLTVHLTTGAGVADATIHFKPAEDSLYYRVVNATISYHTTASAPDTLCGTQSGSKSFDGEFAETDFDPENAITLKNGRLTRRGAGARPWPLAQPPPRGVQVRPGRQGPVRRRHARPHPRAGRHEAGLVLGQRRRQPRRGAAQLGHGRSGGRVRRRRRRRVQRARLELLPAGGPATHCLAGHPAEHRADHAELQRDRPPRPRQRRPPGQHRPHVVVLADDPAGRLQRPAARLTAGT